MAGRFGSIAVARSAAVSGAGVLRYRSVGAAKRIHTTDQPFPFWSGAAAIDSKADGRQAVDGCPCTTLCRCVVLVSQTWQKLAHGLRHVALRAHYFTVIGFSGIEQQNGVSRWCGVQYGKPVLAFIDGSCKCPEYGNFFSAWRAQVFFQHGATTCIQALACLLQNLLRVLGNFFRRVNPGHCQTGPGLGCGVAPRYLALLPTSGRQRTAPEQGLLLLRKHLLSSTWRVKHFKLLHDYLLRNHPASYQFLDEFTTLTTSSITGTSISTPTTVVVSHWPPNPGSLCYRLPTNS
jgi:hypothetical protein